jgi:hypothetical protein
MDDGLWKTRGAGRVENNEGMIEGNMSEDKWGFGNRKEIVRCNATKIRWNKSDRGYAFGMDDTSMEWDLTLGNTTTVRSEVIPFDTSAILARVSCSLPL